MSQIKILVVEDELEINQLVTKYLQKEGYVVDSAYHGEMACSYLNNNTYHLIILDLMIPGIDGYEVLRRIREKGDTPVLILSAKSDEVDKILGLGMGADDYLTKPFSLGELLARVKAQLRRYLYYPKDSASHKQEVTQLKHLDLVLNLETYELKKGDTIIILTAKEFEILKLFFTYPKRVFTKSQIYNAVWGDDYLTDENTVMVHIRRLRTKIEDDPSNPKYIQTVWGIGYKLMEASS